MIGVVFKLCSFIDTSRDITVISWAKSRKRAGLITEWRLPLRVIDSCSALPTSLYPASAILPLPCLPEAECGSGNGTVRGSGFRLWTALQVPPADTACYPSHLTVSEPQRPPGRDGWTVTGVCCRLRHGVSCSNRSGHGGDGEGVRVSPRGEHG